MGNSMSEDVELNICGFGPMDGNWRGRKAMVEATRKNFASLASQRPEIESIICQGDCAAVLLRETGVLKATGQAYSNFALCNGSRLPTGRSGRSTRSQAASGKLNPERRLCLTGVAAVLGVTVPERVKSQPSSRSDGSLVLRT